MTTSLSNSTPTTLVIDDVKGSLHHLKINSPITTRPHPTPAGVGSVASQEESLKEVTV